ncbi:MAG: PD40 domain-containing protein, partial [Bacteroidales bacterium]|nr:PD40 domain-containing protein [Bacteroidales bacterium]
INPVNGQDDFSYQLPPEAIVKIIDAQQTPSVNVSPDNTVMLLLDRPGLVSIAELSAPELRIAGMRLDPTTNSQSRGQSVKKISVMNIDGTNLRSFTGMPAEPEITNISWSDDSKRFTFANTTATGVDLWVADLATMSVSMIDTGLNNIFRGSGSWLPDGSFVYLRTLRNRGKVPVASQVPVGPVVQESEGKQGESRTFQDLLKNAYDEAIFEYYATSELMRWNGTETSVIGKKGIYTHVSPSPDGNWLMISTVERPFSYLVPYNFFPTRTEIVDLTGKVVRALLLKPLQENLPRGYDAVNPGPRSHSWRADKPATLLWVEALDGGDYYAREMKYHDQVYFLKAPFAGDPKPFLSVEKRIQRITWGN